MKAASCNLIPSGFVSTVQKACASQSMQYYDNAMFRALVRRDCSKSLYSPLGIVRFCLPNTRLLTSALHYSISLDLHTRTWVARSCKIETEVYGVEAHQTGCMLRQYCSEYSAFSVSGHWHLSAILALCLIDLQATHTLEASLHLVIPAFDWSSASRALIEASSIVEFLLVSASGRTFLEHLTCKPSSKVKRK